MITRAKISAMRASRGRCLFEGGAQSSKYGSSRLELKQHDIKTKLSTWDKKSGHEKNFLTSVKKSRLEKKNSWPDIKISTRKKKILWLSTGKQNCFLRGHTMCMLLMWINFICIVNLTSRNTVTWSHDPLGHYRLAYASVYPPALTKWLASVRVRRWSQDRKWSRPES